MTRIISDIIIMMIHIVIDKLKLYLCCNCCSQHLLISKRSSLRIDISTFKDIMSLEDDTGHPSNDSSEGGYRQSQRNFS